jgi:hypothetical protein
MIYFAWLGTRSLIASVSINFLLQRLLEHPVIVRLLLVRRQLIVVTQLIIALLIIAVL